MPMTVRPAHRRAVAALTAGAAVVSSAALLAPATSSASSHREAPYTLTDPSADNTDTYAFVSPDDPGQVTLLANWSPFQEPGGGPNFFPWDTSAVYDINVDNDGDAKPDVVYRWSFSDVDARGTVDRGPGNGGTGTFLLNDGQVTELDDPDLRHRQTYDLTVLQEVGGKLVASRLLDDAMAVPNNVGRASVPDYASLRAAGVTDLPGGGVAWAGQADDPFFLDLRVFDLLYGGDLTSVGNDTLEGYNVNTLAVKVPAPRLVAGNNPAKNPVIGVWSTTSRRANRVFAGTNSAPGTSTTDSSDTTRDSGALVQVSRLGNPLVNEAVVPADLKDYFNRSTPDRDGQFLAKVQDPELPALVEAIYKIPNPNTLDNPAAAERNDLSAAFLTGFSKDVFAGRTFGGLGAGVVDADLNSLDLNEVSPEPVPAEYLRLNVMVRPDGSEDRAGVIGGDFQGFPNGRRLGDDVVDIALRVLEGVLVRPEGPTKDAVAGLGDGVDANDKPFLAEFPYVADAHSGSTTR